MRIALISDPLITNYSEPVNKTIGSTHNSVIKNIASAIEKLGHEVGCFEANNELEETVSRIKPQFVFNLSNEEDHKSGLAFTPSLLDKLNIPYTGSNAGVCVSAFNKNKTKRILQEAGIPTSKYCLFTNPSETQIPDSLSFPLFIKPVRGGCSQGIYEQNLVFSKESCMKIVRITIEQSNQPVLVEEFLTGREFTVGILGNDPPRVLPVLEYVNDTRESNNYSFRSFNTKMIEGNSEKKSCPAFLSDIEEDKIINLAVETYLAIGCRDYARIDIRCDKDGIPYVLEVNALPSLIPNGSSFATMAETAGISFDNLISTILISAYERYGIACEHESDLINIISFGNLTPCDSGVF
jgi:D-alanine-D-alanine ligase